MKRLGLKCTEQDFEICIADATATSGLEFKVGNFLIRITV